MDELTPTQRSIFREQGGNWIIKLVDDRDAEIERLKEDVRRWEIVGREADAEIEQLKMNWSWTEDALENLKGEHRDALKLITKLARWAQIYSDQRNVPNLELLKVLQLAREAAKHE
jgi:hypothetical protein